MKHTSTLYFVASALALIAAALVMFSEGFLPTERFRAGFYFFWAAVMFAFGYRSKQKGR